MSWVNLKNKKIHPQKYALYFCKRNFLALISQKFLHFFKRKLFWYFLKRKLFLVFRKLNPVLFSNLLFHKNKRNPPPREFLILQEAKPPKNFLYFLEKSFSYISENGNHEKIIYISGNGTFLYFRKGIFRTLAYSKPETYSEHCQTSTMERFAKIAT